MSVCGYDWDAESTASVSSFQTYIWLELDKFKTSAVHGDDVLRFGRALLWVRLWCFENVCRMFPLESGEQRT